MLPREDIINFIKRYDEDFGARDNIYYAAKAFKTNSVINYLGSMKDTDSLNYDEAELHNEKLTKKDWLKGEADVIWEDGKVLFKLIEGDSQDEQ